MKNGKVSEYSDVSDTEIDSEQEEKQRKEEEEMALEDDRLAKAKSKYYAIM